MEKCDETGVEEEHQDNVEDSKEYQRKQREKEYQRKYYQANKGRRGDDYKIYQKKYNEEHKEPRKKYSSLYYQRNKHKWVGYKAKSKAKQEVINAVKAVKAKSEQEVINVVKAKSKQEVIKAVDQEVKVINTVVKKVDSPKRKRSPFKDIGLRKRQTADEIIRLWRMGKQSNKVQEEG